MRGKNEMKQIDARGLSCPQPVILVSAAIKSGETSIEVLLNTEVSRENVSRLLTKNNFTFEVKKEGDDITVNARK